MRFGIIAAAAAALVCAGQADAARYYEFEVHGGALVAGTPYAGYPGSETPGYFVDSTTRFSYDTQSNAFYLIANGNGEQIYFNPDQGGIYTMNLPYYYSSDIFSFSVDLSKVMYGDTLEFVTPSNTNFGYRLLVESRHGTTRDSYRGDLYSVLARTSDIAPATLGASVGRLSFNALPEPATWAMMIVGLGAVGFAMRRRKGLNTTASYAV